MYDKEKSLAHRWIKKKLGTPETCEHCGKKRLKGQKIHWANKEHKYKKELADWIRLCAKCHVYYDIINGRRKIK